MQLAVSGKKPIFLPKSEGISEVNDYNSLQT